MADAAYYQANRERLLAAAKARYWAKKEEIRAYKKRWQQEHAEEIAAKKRAHYLANKDSISARHKLHYARNAELKKEQSRTYRRNNPSKARTAVIRWCDANRERLRQVKSAYAKAHPELGRAKRARRRAREIAAYIGPIDYQAILEAAHGRCGICGELLGDASYHFDHVVPLARGGQHTQSNIQVAHARCNLKKGAA